MFDLDDLETGFGMTTASNRDKRTIAKLQADLSAAQAKLGTAQSQLLSAQEIITTQDQQVTALKAENERLRKALSIISNAINLVKYAEAMGIDCSQHTHPATTMCAIAWEALQPEQS